MTRTLSLLLMVLLLPVVVMGCGGGFAGEAKSSAAADAPAQGYPQAPGASYASAPVPDPSKKARVSTWKRSRLVPNTSKLMVGDDEALPIRGMQVKVSIDGFRARVVLDYYFANPHERQLEGTFKVRLPDSASPYFFAFGPTVVMAADAAPPARDVSQALAMGNEPAVIMADREGGWEGPKEARMVPRETAAIAYGDTVRRRVDPALMEWSGAGVFSARVFPLAPRKAHRIVMGYDMDLVAAGDDLEMRFDVPEGVPTLVDFDVQQAAAKRITASPGAAASQHAGRAFYRYEDARGALALRLQAPRTTLLRGNDPDTGDYFTTAFRPPLPANAAAARPERAVLLLDTSLSANPDGFNVWLKLLRALLEDNRDKIKQFAVLFFNVEASWYKRAWSDNTAAELDALLAYANTLALEGATDLGGALRAAARPSWSTVERATNLFLLSDGAATWGESSSWAMAKALGRTRPLFAYRSGLAGTDSAALELLTRQSGGAIFSVVGEAEVKAAARAHNQRPWLLEGVEIDGGDDLLVAGRPRALFPGQRLQLVGRGAPQSGAEVRLKVRQPGAGPKTINVKIEQAVTSKLAPRSYGQIAVAQLEELGPSSRKTASPYAMHFRVTGKSASLLMLESEADYRRHNIKPQANAIVVSKRPAAKQLGAMLASLSGSLGNPKAEMMRWLRKMRTTKGVMLDLPESLQVTLDGLAPAAFVVASRPLSVKAKLRADLPEAYAARLPKRKVPYQVVTAEARRRVRAHGPADGLKALSSLIEQSPADAVLARDIGYSAMRWGLNAQAYHLFRRVAAKRPYEPQTYRAMARALERMGKSDLAMAYFEVALAGTWDSRFGDFKTIVTYDYVRMLMRIAEGRLRTASPDYARARLASLRKDVAIGADLVVMITWNTDNTDVDLHVTEPSGEECFYSHPKTRSGGSITQDVTQGYGPEMYRLQRAPDGRYRIRVKYYASDANRLSARTKVQALVFQHFGTERQRVIEKTVTLALGKEMHNVATVSVGAGAGAVMAAP